MLLAFNKPHGVLSQFTPDGSPNRTLSAFKFPRNVYPIGRLDADSEGLLLLSDEPELNRAVLSPAEKRPKTYWAQVERNPSLDSLRALAAGVLIQGQRTLPCTAADLEPQPEIPERTPPIRIRKSVPTRWIALTLVEGKNRQVRRMTAAVGHPTLRLIRVQIGAFKLGELPSGKWRAVTETERRNILESLPSNSGRTIKR